MKEAVSCGSRIPQLRKGHSIFGKCFAAMMVTAKTAVFAGCFPVRVRKRSTRILSLADGNSLKSLRNGISGIGVSD